MEGFPLFDLHPTLLERIVTKVEERSYLRLQQTCKDMSDFVRTQKNIRVRFNTCLAQFKYKEKGPDILSCWMNDQEVDWNSLYGLQFRTLISPTENEKFSVVVDTLRKYRITCTQLDLNFVENKEEKMKPSKENCIELIKVLKPTSVLMNSYGSNRYEALEAMERSEKIEEIYLEVHPDVALSAVNIITKFPLVSVYAQNSEDDCTAFNAREYFKLMHEVLRVLATEPPNLRDIKFLCICDEELPLACDQREAFREYKPIFIRNGYQDAQIFECRFPSGRLFQMVLSKNVGQIRYIYDATEMEESISEAVWI